MNGLTAQFNPYEIFNAQVLQEHTGGGGGFKEEGNVGAQLSVEGGEVEVRRLLVEKSSVPQAFWKTQTQTMTTVNDVALVSPAGPGELS